MFFYPTIITLHIIFAGGWLINLLSNSVMKARIKQNKNLAGEKKLISLYLALTNLFGIVGATGILATGITLVLLNPAYGFFDMSANHWLAAKQILMVLLLIIIFVFIIPTSKKIRASIGSELAEAIPISEEGYANLQQMFNLNTAINIIVFVNFIFAITHRFLG